MDKYIFANWKMKASPSKARELLTAYNQFNKPESVKLFATAPTWFLAEAANYTSTAQIAAQDVSTKLEEGAFTGENSALHLQQLGVKGTLVGHSERRSYMQESSVTVATKMLNALTASLFTTVCVGETSEERSSGKTESVLQEQIGALVTVIKANSALLDSGKLFIGYEPVWAISSTANAQEATPTDVEPVIAFIRNYLNTQLGEELSNKIGILYGGSVNSKNAAGYAAINGIDGFIPGSASLTPVEIQGVIDALAAASK